MDKGLDVGSGSSAGRGEAGGRTLEMVATGAPLSDTLDELMLFIESQEPDLRCGILIVSDDGLHFRRGSGPSLPDAYHDALDGVPITPPYLGSCGEAAHSCVAIEIEDIEQDDRYAEEWRSLLLSCGIRAMRSTPVCGSNAKVLASIAMYFDTPRNPNPADPGLIDVATHLAAIAIEHERSTKALRDSGRHYRGLVAASSNVLYRHSPDWSEMRYLSGGGFLADTTSPDANWFDAYIHPEDQPHVWAAIQEAIRTKSVFELEHRVRRADGTLGWTLSRSTPVFDDKGEIVEWFGAASDITARKEAEEQLRRELAKTKTLQDVSTELIPEQHPERLYARLLDAAAELMEADAASIQMLDPRSGKLKLLAWKKFHPESAAFWKWVDAGSATTCGKALTSNERIVVSDVDDCDFMAGTRDLEEYKRSGIRAVQSTPLVSRSGRPLGMISTHWHERHAFSDGDFHLFDLLTRQAADMIERLGTEAVLRENEERHALLLKVSDALRPHSHPLAIQAEAARIIGEHLKVRWAYYGEADGDPPTHMVVRHCHTRGDAPKLTGKYPVASPVFLAELQAGRTVAIDDMQASPIVGEGTRERFGVMGMRSILAAPIVREGRLLAIFILADNKRVWSDTEAMLIEGVAERTWAAVERARAEAALRDSEAQLRHIIDGAREYAIVTLDHDRVIQNWNAGAERLLGYSEAEALGQLGDIFFTPDDQAAGVPEKELRTALAEGRASNERWHMRKDGSRFWGSGVMLPIEDDEGSLVLKIFRDRTEEREAENRQQILIHELNHRVKNTLATVQAMASQTLRNSKVESEVRQGFEARLHALAAGHDILTRESWGGADLRRIVASALKPFGSSDESRIRIEGPALYLAPKIALAFTMALHELATNATKYGALSAGGEVDVNWIIEGDKLLFRWRESGGPPVAEPTRKGFGSRLIERSLASELGAEVRIEYPPQGVICTIEAPTSELWAASAMKASR